MKIYVYCITRMDNLKYIGITIDKKKRFKAHEKSERFKIGIKYIEIIAECDTYELAEDLEEYYIDLYDTFNNGLNNSKNGKGNHLCENFTTKGFKFSDESKKKMSISAKNRIKRQGYVIKTPAHKIPEIKEKWRKTRKGICWGKRIIDNKIANEIIDEFESKIIFNNEFIKKYVKKSDHNKIGSVPIENLKSTNGKFLSYKLLFIKYYSIKMNVSDTLIRNVLNTGRNYGSALHQSERQI